LADPLEADVGHLTDDYIQVVLSYDPDQYDPELELQNFRLYLNGTLADSASTEDDAYSSYDHSALGGMAQGLVEGGTPNGFDGTIAIFRAYFKRTLEPQEIFRNFQSVASPTVADLQGTVTNYNYPPRLRWTLVSGPGSTLFDNPGQAVTPAAFTEPGTYLLRLEADFNYGVFADEVLVTVEGPEQDTDVDGMINEDELTAGTNPNDAMSVFKANAIQGADGLRMQTPRHAGRYYRISWRASLAEGDWVPLDEPDGTLPSDGSPLDTPLSAEGFYRLEVSRNPF
jgi:hypothetical protein